MKKYFFYALFLLLLLCSFYLEAQLGEFLLQDTPGGPTLHIESGSYLVIDESDTELNKRIEGDGTVKLTGDRTIFYSSNNWLVPRLEVALDSSHSVLVFDTSGVSKSLTFTGSNLYVELQATLFVLGDQATLQGYGPDAFFLTKDNPSAGLLKLGVNNTPFEFPVGFSENQYNPLVIQEEEGTSDVQVRALENARRDGGTGPPFATEAVDASWEIQFPTNPAPSFSILSAQWEGSDELPGFDRNRCGLARYVPGAGWDLTVGNIALAFGSDPYGRERIGLTEGGFFAVGGRALAEETTAEIDVLLGGGYQPGGLMTDELRAGGLLPTLEPYSGLGFNYVGFGPGAPVDPGVFAATGPDAIVDWLFVEVRDGDNPATVVASRPALLQRDGDIVDTDGLSPLGLSGIPPGDYHVAVLHRNHLGIRTAAPLSFGPDGVEYNFISDPSQTFGGTLSLLELDPSVFGLVPGDVDANGRVQNVDVNELTQAIGTSGYRSADADLNGRVQNVDLQLKLLPFVGRSRQF